MSLWMVTSLIKILARVVAHSIHAHIHVHTPYIHAHTLHYIHSTFNTLVCPLQQFIIGLEYMYLA